MGQLRIAVLCFVTTKIYRSLPLPLRKVAICSSSPRKKPIPNHKFPRKEFFARRRETRLLLFFLQNRRFSPKEYQLSAGVSKTKVAGLQPGSLYNVSVAAESKDGLGPVVSAEFWTEIGGRLVWKCVPSRSTSIVTCRLSPNFWNGLKSFHLKIEDLFLQYGKRTT